jgi:hypothetical protein
VRSTSELERRTAGVYLPQRLETAFLRSDHAREKTTIFTWAIIVAAVVIAPAMSQARTADTRPCKTHPNGLQSKETSMPTIDYARAESTDAKQRARRNARGKRHDGSLRVDEPHPEAGAKGILDSWMQTVPALPVDASDAIVIGRISDAQAYLSPDKTGVYTEYTAHIETVLKQYADAFIFLGSFVDAQREGGRVRFPSGRAQSYITRYQGVPVTGRRYVLFLRRNEDGETFYLVTGYEVRDGCVYPLDGVNLNEGATELAQFAPYKEADEASFLRDLRRAISQR